VNGAETPKAKAGDVVFVVYVSFGRWPTCKRATVLQAGLKRITTTTSNGKEHWSPDQIYTDEIVARRRLVELVDAKTREAKLNATEWEQKLAEAKAELRAAELSTTEMV
jgi:hypothetical protein